MNWVKQIRILAALLAAAIQLPLSAAAQQEFAPVITVNEAAITRYEIDQRVRFLRMLNSLGDIEQQAREGLIEDRLKTEAANRAGLEISQGAIDAERDRFLQSGGATSEQFQAAMTAAGIEPETLEEFARVRAIWRELVNDRYGGSISISDSEVDRALAAATGRGGLRVLISEIVIPVQSDSQRNDARALAEEIRRSSTSREEFARAARRYSASPSRDSGGQLEWISLDDLSARVRPVLVGLAPGEVSAPLDLPQAVVLFQMRSVAEAPAQTIRDAALEYALLRLPGPRTAGTEARIARIRDGADTCNDIFPFADDLPEEAITIETLPPSQVPPSILRELDTLDPNEISSRLESQSGSEVYVLMLCGRTGALAADASRDQISANLRAQRLESLAQSWLEELRAAAQIRP